MASPGPNHHRQARPSWSVTTPPHPTPSRKHKASSLSELGFDAGGASSPRLARLPRGCSLDYDMDMKAFVLVSNITY
ncbi:hypothetical protein ZWY2020_033997 [Hordeum vulgare]|nr:hypothetical protein ZWY2020_033997 [Hordeum vulgare]